ncbi:MAG: sulfur carrier protein ThiS [Alcanivoracaceae bacterium]|jgi:sulfur carrier protein|nr:sulfur carrier protein ThiS [Alcanivoracaceae bacterium]
MNLTVNGEPLVFNGSTLADLLVQLELTGRRIAVEVNQDIVPKGEHATHVLRDNDRVEIVHAIGGG